MPFEKIQPLIAWLAPILSTLIVTAATASINAKIAAGERKRDEAKAETEAERRERAEWRAKVEGRLEEQDGKIDAILSAQCTQMRSDLVHRAHHYIGVTGCATLDEKQSFYAEWQEYQGLCVAYGIQNSFIDNIVKQVMALPDTRDGDVTPAHIKA